MIFFLVIYFNTLLELNTVIVILDASIKNNITISIVHVHSFNNHLKKTLYHTIDIMSIETELFALRCGINQAIQIPGSSHIIVITDTLHVAQNLFDSSMHPYQLQLIMISKDFRVFFNSYLDNSIEFWDCPSDEK